ncbi:MAG: hypothetical protein WBG30_03300 [Psychrilyobacter sp.]|uniref:hypothetical protein n=1 Tax=Psychrilyobacter sp. TaxID=2586924 RepID=UPI003C765C37
MNDLIRKLELKRKELNIQFNPSDKSCYFKRIEKSIESLKKASIKKQNKINYKFSKKKYKTVIGAKYIASEDFLSDSTLYSEREYIKDKNQKQNLKDKKFRVTKLKELKRKGVNSQKLGILVEYAKEKIEWILLGDLISQLLEEPLNALKKYFYSIQRSTKLLLGSVALEENRVLLN